MRECEEAQRLLDYSNCKINFLSPLFEIKPCKLIEPLLQTQELIMSLPKIALVTGGSKGRPTKSGRGIDRIIPHGAPNAVFGMRSLGP